MKAPVFEYVAVDKVSDALKLLSDGVDTRILAGGQSLMAMLNMRFIFPERLIDINKVRDLSYIRETNGVIEIGAMTRQRDVEFSTLVADRLPLLKEAILNVGHRQTRNRGTIGGSLCQLDPSAEIPTVSMGLDAKMVIGSYGGTREIDASEFCLGYMSPALNNGEMLLGVKLTPWPQGHGFSFIEFSRRHGDFAIVSCAVAAVMDSRVIQRVSITLGGIGATAVRVVEAEAFLVGKEPTPENVAQVVRLCSQVDASTDAFVTARYRQHLSGVLAGRAVREAVSRCGVIND